MWLCLACTSVVLIHSQNTALGQWFSIVGFSRSWPVIASDPNVFFCFVFITPKNRLAFDHTKKILRKGTTEPGMKWGTLVPGKLVPYTGMPSWRQTQTHNRTDVTQFMLLSLSSTTKLWPVFPHVHGKNQSHVTGPISVDLISSVLFFFNLGNNWHTSVVCESDGAVYNSQEDLFVNYHGDETQLNSSWIKPRSITCSSSLAREMSRFMFTQIYLIVWCQQLDFQKREKNNCVLHSILLLVLANCGKFTQ